MKSTKYKEWSAGKPAQTVNEFTKSSNSSNLESTDSKHPTSQYNGPQALLRMKTTLTPKTANVLIILAEVSRLSLRFHLCLLFFLGCQSRCIQRLMQSQPISPPTEVPIQI